jgi:hypothetical protein
MLPTRANGPSYGRAAAPTRAFDLVSASFYVILMKRECALSALQEYLQAQSELNNECLRRAVSACDPRLKSAWIGVFVRLCDAVVANGHAIADLKHLPGHVIPPVRLCLPRLPALPKMEGGTPPPPHFHKTTSGGISCETSSLAKPPAKPRLPVKLKGGAPRGNRNARKSGAQRASFVNFVGRSGFMCGRSRLRWRSSAPCCRSGEPASSTGSPHPSAVMCGRCVQDARRIAGSARMLPPKRARKRSMSAGSMATVSNGPSARSRRLTTRPCL